MPIVAIEQVAEHIGQCPRCESRLETLNEGGDTVVDYLQKFESGSVSTDEPEFRQLEANAKAIDLSNLDTDSFADTAQKHLPRDKSKRADSRQADFLTTELISPGTQPSAEPFPQPETIDRYIVERRLGEGGFGTVYLAHDPQLDRSVAIKIPRNDKSTSDQDADEFLREAQMAASLKHPSIVPVYDWGRLEDGSCYVVMEYIDGCSLGRYVKTEKPAQGRIIELVIEIADALHHLHKHELVHRDVKPANILVDNTGHARLTDFGLAMHDDDQRVRRDEFAGTRPYMSPEQVRRESHLLDGRTDIWSLGVILYESLTGRRPFRGDTPDVLFDEILHRDPKPPRMIDESIPTHIEEVCLKCLSKQPTERYNAAIDLAKELARAAEPKLFESASRKRTTWNRVAIGALVSAVFLTTAAYVGFRFLGDAPNVNAVPPGIPYKLPASKSVGSTNLLDQHPEKIIWDSRRASNDYDYKADLKSFSVITAGAGAFSLGKNQSKRFELQVRFDVEEWRAWMAVFWGLDMDSQTFPSKCHALYLNTDGAGKLKVSIVEFTLAEDFSVWIRQTNPLSLGEIHVDSSKEMEVKIAIRGGKLENLEIQRVALDVQRLDIRQPLLHDGKIGIVCVDGVYLFTDAWLTTLEE